MPVGILRLIVAFGYRPQSRHLRLGDRSLLHPGIPIERALKCFVGRDGKRLRVVFVGDQVRLVISHIRTVAGRVMGQWPGDDSEESLFEDRMVVRKVLRELTGGGVKGYAIARRQCTKKSSSGVAHEYGILH